MRIRGARHFATILVGLIGLCAGLAVAAAETVTLPKSVPASGKKLDKSKFTGRVISYDDAGFELRVKGDQTETVAWADLDAKTHFVVRKSLLDPKDALAHLELGTALLGLKDGKEWAEKSFAVALKLDPGLKDRVAEVKKEAAESRPAEMLKPDDEGKSGSTIKPPKEGENEGMSTAGPETIGGVEKQFWGEQTDAEQAAAVEELKAFAQKAQDKLNKSLDLKETKFFLFYSDLDPQEVKNWTGVLDRMYGMLADLFAVDKKLNIWRGKALVFVFKSQQDYIKFQMQCHDTDPGRSIGMCHTYGNGIVHIAFFRQPDELQFAHVLVHESSHGFIHRYRSPERIPSWVNEGLSEWLANRLLIEQRPNRQKDVRYNAQYWLRQYRGLGGFFEAQHIDAWQYPVAEMITTYMIEMNKKGYIAFINAIKDGVAWEDALKAKMKYTREALVQEFSQAMGLKL
jgi:hypothetical protein